MLQKRILNFCNIEFSHNAQAIFVSIMSVLQEYGIQNNIFSITFDNTTNNTGAINLFNRQLKTLVGNNLFHIRYVCYIINLIIKDDLKFLNRKLKKLEVSSYILDHQHIHIKN